MKRKSTQADQAGTADFELSLQQLQETVRDLESGELTLTDSLARYESGVGHLRNCLKLLQQTELRIRQLVDVDQEGRAVLKEFEHERSSGQPAPGPGTAGKRPARKKTAGDDLWSEEDDELGGEG